MLIPRPTHIQYRKSATARFFQLKQKKAAIAPMWNTIKTILVIQLIFARFGRMMASVDMLVQSQTIKELPVTL